MSYIVDFVLKYAYKDKLPMQQQRFSDIGKDRVGARAIRTSLHRSQVELEKGEDRKLVLI
jgi:hypothetical protein